MTTGNGQMHAESSGKPRCHIRQASVHACSEGVLPLLHACSIVYGSVIEIGSHRRVVVEEPDGDVLRHARRVYGRAVQRPLKSVVENCVGHVVKLADVVHRAAVGIELPVPHDVGTGDPDCMFGRHEEGGAQRREEGFIGEIV